MRIIIAVSIILFGFHINSSFAQSTCDNTRSSGTYTKDNTQKRVDVLITNNFGSKYYLMQSSLLVLSWTNNDRYNGNEGNISLGILIDLFTKYQLLQKDHNRYISTILSIPNSKHHFFFSEPFFNSDLCKNGSPTLGFIGSSIFIKSNTDLYIFKTNKWMNYSPGIGISFYFIWPYIEFGVSRNILTDFKNAKYENSFFFTLGLVGRND